MDSNQEFIRREIDPIVDELTALGSEKIILTRTRSGGGLLLRTFVDGKLVFVDAGKYMPITDAFKALLDRAKEVVNESSTLDELRNQ